METLHTKDQIKELNRTSILCDKLIEINRSHYNKALSHFIDTMILDVQSELKKYQHLVGKIVEYSDPPIIGKIEKLHGFSASGTIVVIVRYSSGESHHTLLKYLKESDAKVDIP